MKKLLVTFLLISTSIFVQAEKKKVLIIGDSISISLTRDFPGTSFSFVFLYTLQFVPIKERKNIIQKLYRNKKRKLDQDQKYRTQK